MEGFKSRLDTTEEMTHSPEENIQVTLQQDKKFRKYRKEPERETRPNVNI